MAHKTLLDGTAYEITGGKDLLDGTGYSKVKGRTLVDGAGYDIPFGQKVVPSYTGNYNLYGDENQGWIEMLTSGVLTIPHGAVGDLYLISTGMRGGYGHWEYSNNANNAIEAGAGGDGGRWIELFGVKVSETTDVTIITTIYSGYGDTVFGDHSSSAGTCSAKGGAGATATKSGGTYVAAKNGGDGRQPFSGNNPMSQGFAQYKLGAGGGGGPVGYVSKNSSTSYLDATYAERGTGGTYGGGAGSQLGASGNYSSEVKGKANTGGGGGGGWSAYGYYGNSGGTANGFNEPGSGIAIFRWGY